MTSSEPGGAPDHHDRADRARADADRRGRKASQVNSEFAAGEAAHQTAARLPGLSDHLVVITGRTGLSHLPDTLADVEDIPSDVDGFATQLDSLPDLLGEFGRDGLELAQRLLGAFA